MNIAQLGNDLYSGRRSIDFVGRRKTWYLVSLVLFLLAVAGLGIRHLNLGIEFTGGSDFRIAKVSNLDGFEQRARSVIATAGGVEGAKVTKVGTNDVRVETTRFETDKSQAVAGALAKEFGVPTSSVTTSVIGPSWGASVSRQALWALIWFLALVSVVLAIYFRTWKMAVAALVALFHDIFITVGIYALAGFEVTPASMIGFLTILGYSLYDTVVVFDKVRENTDAAVANGRSTFSEAANLAVNQTLVRSINTTVVALLPVAAILVVGLVLIGPGTLLDLALALFVGIAVGAYSSIFIATPLLAHLRESEPEMRKLAHRVERRRGRSDGKPSPQPAADLDDEPDDAPEEEATSNEETLVASSPRTRGRSRAGAEAAETVVTPKDFGGERPAPASPKRETIADRKRAQKAAATRPTEPAAEDETDADDSPSPAATVRAGASSARGTTKDAEPAEEVDEVDVVDESSADDVSEDVTEEEGEDDAATDGDEATDTAAKARTVTGRPVHPSLRSDQGKGRRRGRS